MTILTKATGGYVLTRIPLVRTGFSRHTAGLDKPVSELSVRALNLVQSTPWRINTWLLDVLQEAFAAGIPLPGLEIEELPALPPRQDDAVWAALSEDERAARIAQRREIHETRNGILGRHNALLDKLMVSERMRSAERIWFPHTLDFRGRLYPIPVAGPHPQSDDLGRALIHFADGVPLGDPGLF